jgi:hypothetical protein
MESRHWTRGREQLMATAIETPVSPKNADAPTAHSRKESKRRGGRRSRRAGAPEGVRYFVGKAPENGRGPAFQQEAATEAEALVIAFKSDLRVYLVSEYTVAQNIDRGRVTLNKQPVCNQQVSTINAS